MADLLHAIGASPAPAYVVLPSSYTALITVLVAGYGKTMDPALVEGWMRLSHPTFDHLTAQAFRLQVASAITCVQITPLQDSIDLAASFGLVQIIPTAQDIASPARPASGGALSEGEGAAPAALPSTESATIAHPAVPPRRSFRQNQRRIVELLQANGEHCVPAMGRALPFRENH